MPNLQSVMKSIRDTEKTAQQATDIDENIRRDAVRHHRKVKTQNIQVEERSDVVNINIENAVRVLHLSGNTNTVVDVVDHEVGHQANLGVAKLKDNLKAVVGHPEVIAGRVRSSVGKSRGPDRNQGGFVFSFLLVLFLAHCS